MDDQFSNTPSNTYFLESCLRIDGVMMFNATLNNISVISWWLFFIGVGHRSTRRKPSTWCKSL